MNGLADPASDFAGLNDEQKAKPSSLSLFGVAAGAEAIRDGSQAAGQQGEPGQQAGGMPNQAGQPFQGQPGPGPGPAGGAVRPARGHDGPGAPHRNGPRGWNSAILRSGQGGRGIGSPRGRRRGSRRTEVKGRARPRRRTALQDHSRARSLATVSRELSDRTRGLDQLGEALQEVPQRVAPPVADPTRMQFKPIQDNPFVRASGRSRSRPSRSTWTRPPTRTSAASCSTRTGSRRPTRCGSRSWSTTSTTTIPSPGTTTTRSAVDVEVARCPWDADHRLVRIGLQGPGDRSRRSGRRATWCS